MITLFQALLALSFLATASASCASWAADFPPPKEGEWIAREFKFHTGEVLAELNLHYTIVGEPTGIPVVILHGTSQSAAMCLLQPLAASCSEQDNHWMPLNTTLSFRMHWDMGKVQNPQTV